MLKAPIYTILSRKFRNCSLSAKDTAYSICQVTVSTKTTVWNIEEKLRDKTAHLSKISKQFSPLETRSDVIQWLSIAKQLKKNKKRREEAY